MGVTWRSAVLSLKQVSTTSNGTASREQSPSGDRQLLLGVGITKKGILLEEEFV